MLKAVYQSVVTPREVLKNPKSTLLVERYGWVFIVIRWLSYSVIFVFRDYHGSWEPFVPPPFGLSVDVYAFLQRSLALPFGVGLMVGMSPGLSGYLHLIKKSIPLVKIVNILGVTFFVPWVILQVADGVLLHTVGWRSMVVIPVHTIVLVWESAAAAEIISRLCNLKSSEKVLSTAVIVVIWIFLCAVLWR